MFDIKKLTFQTKLIIVSVIVIFISMGIVYLKNQHSIIAVKINDWVFITGNDDGNWYYKSNLIFVDKQTHIIKVWVKTVYSDKGKHDFLKIYKNEKYNEFNHSLSLVLIDYQNKNYHEDNVVYYSNSGNIIGGNESTIKYISIPKSVGDKLLIKILAKCNIKR